MIEVTLSSEPVMDERCAEALLANIEREYPNQISYAAEGPVALLPPRQRHPIFFGCYDWHSAVHSHWALLVVRAQRARIEAELARRITAAAVAGERGWLDTHSRFELPYGLAWLLCLCAEVRRRQIGEPVLALEPLARDRLVAWVRALPGPVRSGEHASSMFAMTLALDWARATGDAGVEAELAARACAFHAVDRDWPWELEPSAYDFLSPGLSTAWLMTRALDGAAFVRWLDDFAPELGRGLVLSPPIAADPADGKLVHWSGLALSRAWMLADLAAALPPGDERIAALIELADRHGAAGVRALDGATYAGMHWLPTFALYWRERRYWP